MNNAITDGIDEAIAKHRAKIADEYDQRAESVARKAIISFLAGVAIFVVAIIFSYFNLLLVAQIIAGVSFLMFITTAYFYLRLEEVWADKRRWLSNLKD